MFSAQAGPAAAVPLIAAAIAMAVVLLRGPWLVSRTVITIVHEAGHALVALLSGRRLHGILLHSDTSGVTVSRGKRTGPGMVLTSLAGYPAPAMLGVLFSALIGGGRQGVVLVACALLVLGVLVLVRNAYGVFAVLVTAIALALIAAFGTRDVTAGFVYAITWFLLLGAVRAVVELQRKRRTGLAADSDVDQLARLTGLPSTLWSLALGVLVVGCLVVGGMPLLEPVLGGPER
ncbi:MAG: M50 family peptidase [Actinophytocola sp.]|nr:M50 family peptidase [Actinophytocola sp.]